MVVMILLDCYRPVIIRKIVIVISKCEIIISTTRTLVMIVFEPFQDTSFMKMMRTFWIVGKRHAISFLVIDQANGATWMIPIVIIIVVVTLQYKLVRIVIVMVIGVVVVIVVFGVFV